MGQAISDVVKKGDEASKAHVEEQKDFLVKLVQAKLDEYQRSIEE